MERGFSLIEVCLCLCLLSLVIGGFLKMDILDNQWLAKTSLIQTENAKLIEANDIIESRYTITYSADTCPACTLEHQTASAWSAWGMEFTQPLSFQLAPKTQTLTLTLCDQTRCTKTPFQV